MPENELSEQKKSGDLSFFFFKNETKNLAGSHWVVDRMAQNDRGQIAKKIRRFQGEIRVGFFFLKRKTHHRRFNIFGQQSDILAYCNWLIIRRSLTGQHNNDKVFDLE